MQTKWLVILVWSAALALRAGDLVWFTNMPKAMAQARAEHKLVLADFTGSDWCVWCQRLDKDTLSKKEFADYAKTNLVLVQLDYPDQKPQADELKAANAVLKDRFKVDSFPTLIYLRPDATVLWRVDGYFEGGPTALIAELEKHKNR